MEPTGPLRSGLMWRKHSRCGLEAPPPLTRGVPRLPFSYLYLVMGLAVAVVFNNTVSRVKVVGMKALKRLKRRSTVLLDELVYKSQRCLLNV